MKRWKLKQEYIIGIPIVLMLLFSMNSKSQQSTISFKKSIQSFEPKLTNSLEMADLDNDGDADVAFSNYGPNNSQVWLNDGRGNFSDIEYPFTPMLHIPAISDSQSR